MTVTIVQDKRGTFHACAAYIDGALAAAWEYHPCEHDWFSEIAGVADRRVSALAELREIVRGHVVEPLRFMPRKFEEWRWGRGCCKHEGYTELGDKTCDCDDTWPQRLDELPDFVDVPRDDDSGWPFGTLPVDWMALASLFGPIEVTP